MEIAVSVWTLKTGPDLPYTCTWGLFFAGCPDHELDGNKVIFPRDEEGDVICFGNDNSAKAHFLASFGGGINIFDQDYTVISLVKGEAN